MAGAVRERNEIWLVLIWSILCCVTFAVDYDYLWEVHQWPPSTCSESGLRFPCPKPVPHRFTIHGLWPQLESGHLTCSGPPFDITKIFDIPGKVKEEWPNVNSSDNRGFWKNELLESGHLTCSGPPFDITKIADIQGELKKEWPNVKGSDNRGFWKNEWDKHGTCFSPNNQKLYFETGLNLRRSADIYEALTIAGINPGLTSRNRRVIKLAIKNKIGYEPVLRCNDGQDGNRHLWEIVLCYTKGQQPAVFNCPFKGDNCYGDFIWPAAA